MSAVTDLPRAIDASVDDGDTVHLTGFSHLIPFAAGHELIRQGKSNLTLSRLTPDLIAEQLIAAGCVDRLVFSYAGNPGVGSLYAFRRACEDDIPHPLTIEEYTHYAFISRLAAGASDLPFLPVRTMAGSDLLEHTDNVAIVENPFEGGDDATVVVPPYRPDVAIVHAQRASPDGAAHLWGIYGDVREAALAADTVVMTVEEIVDESVIRSDPNRTVIPDSAVDYVIECPFGAHPSYAQGYQLRDNTFYREWGEISETHDSTLDWLDAWVHEVPDREAYIAKLDAARLHDLTPNRAPASPVDYGRDRQ